MLPGGIDMTHGEVLHDLGHVLVGEECVPARFVWEDRRLHENLEIMLGETKMIGTVIQNMPGFPHNNRCFA